MIALAQGTNHKIEGHRGVLAVALVQRPDLPATEELDATRQMFDTLLELCELPDHTQDALLLDLRRAPIAAAAAREVIAAFLGQWYERGRRIAVISGVATTTVMFEQLLADWSAAQGRCFEDARQAARWAVAPPVATAAPPARPLGFARSVTGAYVNRRERTAPDLTPPEELTVSRRPTTGTHLQMTSRPTTASRHYGTMVTRGDNYALFVGGRVGMLVMVRRPDLSLACAARNAREMIAAATRLPLDHEVDTLVLDLSEAPLPSPDLRTALGELLSRWARARRRIAVVAQQATMRMLCSRLCDAQARGYGEVFDDVRSARLWAAGVPREALSEARPPSPPPAPARSSLAELDDDDEPLERPVSGARSVLGTNRGR